MSKPSDGVVLFKKILGWSIVVAVILGTASFIFDAYVENERANRDFGIMCSQLEMNLAMNQDGTPESVANKEVIEKQLAIADCAGFEASIRAGTGHVEAVRR